ncbi:hypothetical protein QAD02_009754 [Eretmocerus hayati]|uniref:Uncharacterized protein n=1 Tax=Eretmocerus hayati TaxID=131215 RepID=A0ACC2NAK4_9HYME|nr:hypothetical protein QAD02_009754 [Eretmocerus hayati]
MKVIVKYVLLNRQLECQGFQYEDIVVLLKAFKDDSKSSASCDCSFKTSTGTRSRKSNQESDYLKENFGTILPVAIREVVLRKPYDPIEYLGNWLLHYRDCEERAKRMKELEAELLEERAKLPKESVSEPITCYDYCEEAEEESEAVE